MNKRARFEQIDDYLEQFAQQSDSSFTEFRQQAAAALQQYGFPGLKTEDWKYTNVKPLLKQVYPTASDKSISKQQIDALILEDANQLVFVNGFYHEELSNFIDDNFIILPICEAYKEHQSLVKNYFATAVPMQQTGFTALNTLLFKNGYFLQIKATPKYPLHILHISTDLKEEAIHSRNLLLLEKNVVVNIVEQYVSLSVKNNYWCNSISEIFLLDNSQLNYYKLQAETLQAQHTNFIAVKQARDSIFNSFNFDFGAKLVRNDLQATLQAPGASCDFSGLYLTRGQQHVDNHTMVDHAQQHTYSHEYYKGILADESRAVFNGRILVRQDAQKIHSEQKNDNLLLSNKAEIDTKPELEIYANDVICAHGATVGQLNEKSIFYLQARGLDENLARKLLTYGFAYEVLEKIKDENIRSFITQHLAVWFANDQWLQELVQ